MINTKLLIIGTTTAVITPIAALAIVVGVRTNKDKEITVAAPALAIAGLNVVEVTEIKGIGDMSGKTYTKEQIDAREATRAPIGAIFGVNSPEKTTTTLDIGDGSGKTYTQAQIDAREGSVAGATGQAAIIPGASAIIGSNKTGMGVGPASGDSSGNDYSKAQIDARDATAAPVKAVVGVNSAGVPKTTSKIGNGDGQTYSHAQIDKRDGGDKVAPKNAIIGVNTKETKPVKATGDGSGNTYTAAQVRLRDILKFG